MISRVEKIIPDTILSFLKKTIVYNKYTFKLAIAWKFKKKHGYILNLQHPKTFNEKLQYRNYYGNYHFMSLIADKYKVRKYVEKKIGSTYFIPLIRVFNNITLKDLKRLPEDVILKTNNAAGTDSYSIIRKGDDINKAKTVEKLNSALKIRMSSTTGEKFYDLIKPKILAEKLLLVNGKIPDDYKFHCFNSKTGFNYILQIDYDRASNHTRNLYDSSFNKLDISYKHKTNDIEQKKPKNYQEMVEIARILSSDFDYIRVDLYNADGNIYFGELTQTSACGFGKFNPAVWDERIGHLWNLDYSNEMLYRKNNPLNFMQYSSQND